MNNIPRLLRQVFGHAAVLSGGVLMLSGLLGIFDPQSIPQADDGDPFGVSPSVGSLWIFIGIGLLLIVVGRWAVQVRHA
ncbi:hypothetical protein [Pseudoxanthomonas beigongshangi]